MKFVNGCSTAKRVTLVASLLGSVSVANAQWVATVISPEGAWDSMAYGFAGSRQVGYASVTGGTHAMLWNGSASSCVDLNPTGFNSSYAIGGTNNYQLGMGFGEATGYKNHALMWSGTAESMIDLHPVGFYSSVVGTGNETHQVGTGYINENDTHALMWSGTAASVIDLHPVGYTSSSAGAIVGANQFGSASGNTTGNKDHAFMWSGSADSAVDLHPAGYEGSFIRRATNGGQIGTSWQSPLELLHATLWNGSAASAVDLNPEGYFISSGFGISSFGQVGSGKATPNAQAHALYWNGSAASMIDLHSTLSDFPQFTDSEAFGIDDNGDIVGCAYVAGFRPYAVRWTHVVPEPTSMLALGLGAAALLRRGRKA